ncbi:MAG: hypothetical protein P4L61_03825 [Candidatus Pacebacteria bacterium]|nr:hypothetical protein [Candidatus Paceibacterota bacterium]
MLDREELFIICRTGLPDMNGEHYRSLEVTTPHEFENRLGSELNNERYKTLLYIRSNVYPGSDSEPGQEQIWLNYSGLSGRDFNPAVHGSERILAIHVRLQELLKSASPLVVAELKRSQQAKA